MESFISALKDLLKYELIKQINTGDKTLDNLLNTFLLTILGWLFTFAIVKNLSYFYKSLLQKLKKKEIETINKNNYDYLQKSITLFSKKIHEHLRNIRQVINFII